MPNLNRFDILSISIFCKIALSISISISIFSKITISISIFLELPYRYRYFSELPYRYRYRYRYFQLLHIDIDIDIDIFQKCRYIDNRYVISIYRQSICHIDISNRASREQDGFNKFAQFTTNSNKTLMTAELSPIQIGRLIPPGTPVGRESGLE